LGLVVNALTVRDLTVSYRGHPAVHHLSGALASGSFTAVVGPNGAGKSSLLGALAGVLPYQGQIERPDPAPRMAYLPQAAALDRTFPVQVHEVVASGLWWRTGWWGGLRTTEHHHVRDALARVGLSGFERRWLGELSVGQVQRVLFARVLVQDAGLILLDEPFNAVDARTTADLLDLLTPWRQEGRTLVAVLHDLNQVRAHFDRCVLLARECIAWGPTADVLRPEHLERARHMARSWDESAALCEGVRS
jgi:zinc/manganese transport system ATP-binding protein